jgi:acyl dehydratase
MTIEKAAFTYNRDKVILYALGIGLGRDQGDLDFVYEKDLKVFPSFAVVPFMQLFMEDFIYRVGIDLQHLLHGEHHIRFHKPIPPEGIVYSDLIWEAVYDKGDAGAVVAVHSTTTDGNGDTLFENRALWFDRSAGNFGGDRGPKSPKQPPVHGGGPDFRAKIDTAPQQAALYRLSGDKNPLHIDPLFARGSGLERPILHGLCTFGLACRSVLRHLCGNDPSRLASISARFIEMVYPGDTLTIEGWEGGESGTVMIRAANQEGKVVLDHARASLVRPG